MKYGIQGKIYDMGVSNQVFMKMPRSTVKIMDKKMNMKQQEGLHTKNISGQ